MYLDYSDSHWAYKFILNVTINITTCVRTLIVTLLR